MIRNEIIIVITTMKYTGA